MEKMRNIALVRVLVTAGLGSLEFHIKVEVS